MKRDDRLYDFSQIMRDGRLHTAAELATAVGVSVRTIWRDMGMMSRTGLPVEGERGLGYILRTPRMQPPTLLTQDELDTLAEALRRISEDDTLPRHRPARSLLTKIATLMPQAGID